MTYGPIISGKDQVYEWVAPIDYGSVVFDGAGLFPQAGTFYHDASARKNHGRLVNSPTWKFVPELGRWATATTGTQYARTASLPYSANTVPRSYFAWVNATSISGDTYRWIIDRYGDALAIRVSTGQFLHFHGAGSNYRASTATITLNTWMHVGFAWDGTNGTFYINGVADNSYTLSNSGSWSAGVNIWSIHAFYNNSFGFIGQIASPICTDGTALSPSQIQWLANPANNPWQPWRRKSWAVSGGAATETINATTGTVEIEGHAASISAGTTIAATTAAVEIDGKAANVSAGTTVAVTKGEIEVAGKAATLSIGTTIAATSGSVEIEGKQASVESGETISATAGQIQIEGHPASISAGTTISATTAAIEIEGQPANVSAGTTIDAELGQIACSGFAASISAGTTISASLGEIQIAGKKADVDTGTTEGVLLYRLSTGVMALRLSI